MAYSPYKMKGHTLPGIKQSPAKGYGHKSPAKKELVGDQHNLPEELKSKIKASPAKQDNVRPDKRKTVDIRSKKSFKDHTMEEAKKTERASKNKSWGTGLKPFDPSKMKKKTKKVTSKSPSPAKIAPLVAMAAPMIGKAVSGMMSKDK